MAVAGAILIVGGGLKVHQLLTEPIVTPGFWESRLFFLIQIPLELGLGIWLVCGLFRKAAWLLGVICFALFSLITLHRGLSGAASCGCFGIIVVNPWITLFAIDLPLFLILLVFPVKGQKLLPPPWPSARHFFGVAVPTFIVIVTVMVVLITNKPPDKTDRYEVLKPAEWVVNREWPILEYIDVADSLRSNICVVLLYKSECDDCHQAITLYEQLSRDMSENADSLRFALIELSPYALPADNPVSADTTCVQGRVDDDRDWYGKTPIVAVLEDGLLVAAWEQQAPGLEQILDVVFSQNQ